MTRFLTDPEKIFLNEQYDHDDGVDIYLFDDTINHPVSQEGYGSTTGVGRSSKLLITGTFKGLPAYPMVRSYVIAHEMGHVFNLWHIRHGTFTESGDPNPFQCAEWVNGLNGSECGDYIMDTPADPDIAFNLDYPACEWTTVLYDENGDQYDPDEHNIMARTHVACMEYFTFLQSRRMKKALALLPFL